MRQTDKTRAPRTTPIAHLPCDFRVPKRSKLQQTFVARVRPHAAAGNGARCRCKQRVHLDTGVTLEVPKSTKHNDTRIEPVVRKLASGDAVRDAQQHGIVQLHKKKSHKGKPGTKTRN